MDKSRFLKSLVIALGVAVFVALAFVIYGIVALANRPKAAEAVIDTPTAFPDSIDLNLGPSAEIVSASPVDDSLIAITVRVNGQADRILVVDRANGRVIQTIFAHDTPR
ncbi:MAG: hypothetical protein KDE14_14080 [Rhodobacteraceae bacterium]|nr:hypothetical protein [Paracoccaceae bacterium]